MAKYLVGVYEERFGTILVNANSAMEAAEQVEEALQGSSSVTEIDTFTEESFDKGVAIDASEPEELRLAVHEIFNNS